MFCIFDVNDFCMASIAALYLSNNSVVILCVFFAAPSLKERTGFTLLAALLLNMPGDL